MVSRLANIAEWTMKEKYKYYGINTIGYLDIETSGLTADFDIMLTWAILIRNVKTGEIEVAFDSLRKSDFELGYKKKNADLIDKRILESLVQIMNECDCLIGHWFVGKHRHDMPFIRTRLAINKIDGLPKHRAIRFGDTQKWSSLLYRTHNFGLDTVADMFDVGTKKTRLEPKIWKNACIGVPDALKYILDHNIKDVKITYKVHKGLEEYVPIPATYA